MVQTETTVGFEVLPLPTFLTTIGEFAKSRNITYMEAQGLIKYLENKGIAEKVAKKKTSLNGKGKPSDVYMIPLEVKLNLAA